MYTPMNSRWGTILIALLMAGMTAAAEPQGAVSGESLEVRSARAQLRLAEANLLRMERANQRVAGTIPSEVVNEYRDDVAVAKARLERALGGSKEAQFLASLRNAQAGLRAVEAQWTGAQAANRRTPGAYDEMDVERLRLLAEVARLRVERGQALVGKSPEAQREWQIEYLTDEVQRLREAVFRNPPVSRVYPLWWY